MGIGDHKITCINNSSKIKSGFKVGMSNSLQGLFFDSGFPLSMCKSGKELPHCLCLWWSIYFTLFCIFKKQVEIFFLIKTIGRFVKQY